MATIKVTLTEDDLKLISNFRYREFPDKLSEDDSREVINWGFDLNSLYGGNFLIEDLANILGYRDSVIPETLVDWDGPKYPDDITEHLYAVHDNVFENLQNIEEILHQFILKGGIKPGTYKCKSYDHIWEYVEQ